MAPSWGDDFDLTAFFRKLHPRRFQLRDAAEYAPAETLFELVQRMILRWTAIYRSIVRSAHRHPELVAGTILCVRTMNTLDAQAHQSWFVTISRDFEGLAPRDWFLRNRLDELASLLQIEPAIHSATQCAASAGVPNVVEEIHSEEGITELFRGEASISAEARTRLANWLTSRTNPVWEPEFDFKSLLDRWRPEKQSFSSTADRLLASELFDILETEFFGWLALYRSALRIGRERSGVIPKTLRCLHVLQSIPLTRYLEWFRSPLPEFGGESPEQFFAGSGLFDLVFLLKGASPRARSF